MSIIVAIFIRIQRVGSGERIHGLYMLSENAFLHMHNAFLRGGHAWKQTCRSNSFVRLMLSTSHLPKNSRSLLMDVFLGDRMHSQILQVSLQLARKCCMVVRSIFIRIRSPCKGGGSVAFCLNEQVTYVLMLSQLSQDTVVPCVCMYG